MADTGKETGGSSQMPDAPKNTEKAPRKVMEVIRDHTMRATAALRANLEHQREDAGDDDLGEITKRKVETHITELKILDGKLLEVTADPPKIRPVVRQFKQQAGRFDSDNQSTIRWADSPVLPLGPSHPQIQLDALAVITALESISAAIYAESLKGTAPERVLQGLLARSQGQIININTVAVYRNILTERPEVDPQAGISFIWRRGENTARVAGVTYVGRHAFTHDLGLTIPYEDFYLMQRALMAAARPQARPGTTSR